jgi:hypothetical protein
MHRTDRKMSTIIAIYTKIRNDTYYNCSWWVQSNPGWERRGSHAIQPSPRPVYLTSEHATTNMLPTLVLFKEHCQCCQRVLIFICHLWFILTWHDVFRIRHHMPWYSLLWRDLQVVGYVNGGTLDGLWTFQRSTSPMSRLLRVSWGVVRHLHAQCVVTLSSPVVLVAASIFRLHWCPPLARHSVLDPFDLTW